MEVFLLLWYVTNCSYFYVQIDIVGIDVFLLLCSKINSGWIVGININVVGALKLAFVWKIIETSTVELTFFVRNYSNICKNKQRYTTNSGYVVHKLKLAKNIHFNCSTDVCLRNLENVSKKSNFNC